MDKIFIYILTVGKEQEEWEGQEKVKDVWSWEADAAQWGGEVVGAPWGSCKFVWMLSSMRSGQWQTQACCEVHLHSEVGHLLQIRVSPSAECFSKGFMVKSRETAKQL